MAIIGNIHYFQTNPYEKILTVRMSIDVFIYMSCFSRLWTLARSFSHLIPLHIVHKSLSAFSAKKHIFCKGNNDKSRNQTVGVALWNCRPLSHFAFNFTFAAGFWATFSTVVFRFISVHLTKLSSHLDHPQGFGLSFANHDQCREKFQNLAEMCPPVFSLIGKLLPVCHRFSRVS